VRESQRGGGHTTAKAAWVCMGQAHTYVWMCVSSQTLTRMKKHLIKQTDPTQPWVASSEEAKQPRGWGEGSSPCTSPSCAQLPGLFAFLRALSHSFCH